MDLQKREFTVDFAGKPLKVQISKMAEQANAAVVATYGDTSVLVTAVMGDKDKDADYFPLIVDYEERFYAAGKIIGSRFVRREGRPSEEAILSGRLIDRTIRPLFDQRLRRDVQIVVTILSYDDQNDPDFLALFSASTALMISNIPWGGPVAGTKITQLKDGRIILNPTNTELGDESSRIFEAFIAGTEDRLNMFELAGYEAKESDVVKAFSQAHEEIKKLMAFQKEIAKEIGKPKANVLLKEYDETFKAKTLEFISGKLESAVYVKDKEDGKVKMAELKTALKEYLVNEGIDASQMEALLEEEIDALMHKNIIEKEQRPDGRRLDEIRPLHAEVGLFRRLHGSALFVRGGTQSLAVTTLAAPGSEQLVESMEKTSKRRFMLHYNFPPYSTGEIGRVGAPGRREIGHGALAEKAVRSIIPSQEEFPYTIRVVSEILASNGSSSMATVCASTLSLMDAGVPIKKPVAGIAMGLASNKSGQYKILTDIQGPEDHYGDMDCKVAGTEEGITAIQMDVKIEGITLKILEEVLAQAKKARLQILDVIKSVIAAPREKVSDFAPVIMTININPEQIGEVIGPGGKMINGIIAQTGVLTIDIEQTGKVYVAADNLEKAKSAIKTIEAITKEYAVGEIVEGDVIKILEFGAIVDIGGGNDGMVHVSELKNGFVKKVEDVIKVGDHIRAKIIKLDNGKIGLSIKALSAGNGNSDVKSGKPENQEKNGNGNGKKEKSLEEALDDLMG